MAIEFEISSSIPASPEEIYWAWLDSAGHTKMTGGKAVVSDQVGETFTAWDGYIEGKNLELEPGTRIVQSWRNSEFSEDEEDSHLEILLEKEGEGTKITLRHSNLPPHGGQYKQGWVDSYFNPMKAYFGSQ